MVLPPSWHGSSLQSWKKENDMPSHSSPRYLHIRLGWRKSKTRRQDVSDERNKDGGNAGEVGGSGHSALPPVTQKVQLAFNFWHFEGTTQTHGSSSRGPCPCGQQGNTEHHIYNSHYPFKPQFTCHFSPLRLPCHKKSKPVLTESVRTLQGEAAGLKTYATSFPHRQSWKLKRSVHHRQGSVLEAAGNKPCENRPKFAVLWKCQVQRLWAHDEKDALCATVHPTTRSWWCVHTTHPPASGYKSTFFFSKYFPSLPYTFSCNVQMVLKDGIRI